MSGAALSMAALRASNWRRLARWITRAAIISPWRMSSVMVPTM
jgi:hypothetical protein